MARPVPLGTFDTADGDLATVAARLATEAAAAIRSRLAALVTLADTTRR